MAVIHADLPNLGRLVEPVVTGMGYELWGYEFQYGKNQALLRVYIDKREGVCLDDCESVSRQLSAVLDVEDPIHKPYLLEVSSPGLDRLLITTEQYRRYLGKQVKIRTKWLLDGRRNFTGILIDVDQEKVQIKQDDSCYSLPMEAVYRTRLVPEV